MPSSQAVTAIKNWITDMVIGHNFCPFAKQPMLQGKVRFAEQASKKQADVLQALIAECEYLDAHQDVETTLLILTKACADFYPYLDLLDMANELLAVSGYEGVYQLASFHPLYCFDGCEFDDVANYTNRSPWPLLHLIREASLETVLKNVEEPELIPERNIEQCERLGLRYFQARFEKGFN